MTESSEIVFHITGEPDADAEELSRVSDNLREELQEAGADSVERLRATAAAPAGSKGDPITLSSLLVTLAPAALTGVVTMLQSWLTRHDRTSITLEKGGEKITITGSLSGDQQRLISEWLQKDRTA